MEKIITFGEIMLRLAPPEYNKIDQTHYFMANYGGGEANVAVSLSHFDHNTFFMSKLPPHTLGDSAIQHLKSHGVNTDYVIRGGKNLGIYFLETGFGGRPSKVIYNREHSAITQISHDEFDFENIFKNATWFHVSGISLALGEKVRNVVMKSLKTCKKYNVTVSFDFNYRAKLWPIVEATPCYREIMPYIDVVFGSYYDFNTILGISPKDNFTDPNVRRASLFKQVINEYNLKYIFGTERTIFSATENSLSGYCISSEIEKYTDPIRFNIYDRIGGGDAFAAGVIHGLILDFNNPCYALDFGLVTSVLKHTIYGDVCVLKTNDIIDYMKNSGLQCVDR
ncbi:PfkB family carbohydrate kinase [Fusobacterium sp. PH5-44]|uniref:PfkB family carbohydrate kinase n=1 Tax=unclassified Fusobacterium TaxID=2648384 RepID=UPI003D1D51B5